MRLYLHIGTMKTGSTSIQNLLYINRDFINNQGYHYPLSVKNYLSLNDHNPIAYKLHFFLQNNDVNNTEAVSNVFKELIDEIKTSGVENIIISTENIQFLFYEKERIEKLKILLGHLGFDEIKIIVYLRDPKDLFVSMCSQALKDGYPKDFLSTPSGKFEILCNHKNTLQCWGEVFGKENLIVRIFDKNEFYNKDLLQDFIHALGITWSDEYKIPPRENETLDLLGMEILKRLNEYEIPSIAEKVWTDRYENLIFRFFDKHFTSKDSHLVFKPPLQFYQSYIDYFKESNEWVREQFFPHKNSLFANHVGEYKENYELTQINGECWDRIAAFIADILKEKNEMILNLRNSKQSAKDIVLNDLEYKLGETIVEHSNGMFDYIKLPWILSYIIKKHPKDTKQVALESLPDYEAALEIKNGKIYKLGKQYLEKNANNNNGGGGGEQPSIFIKIA